MSLDRRTVQGIIDSENKYRKIGAYEIVQSLPFESSLILNLITWEDQREMIFKLTRKEYFTNEITRGLFALANSLHSQNRLNGVILQEELSSGVMGADTFQKEHNWPHIAFSVFMTIETNLPRRLTENMVSDWCTKRAFEIRTSAMKRNVEMFGAEKARAEDKKLQEIFSQNRASKMPLMMDEVYNQFIDDWEKKQEGVHFWECYDSLHHTIQGFRPGDLSVIGARPGHGKTMFAVSTAVHLVRKNEGLKVCLVNLEMPPNQIIPRIIQSWACRTTEDMQTFRRNALSIFRDKIFKDDRFFCTPVMHKPIEDILEYLQPLIERGYKVFFFDYIQLMKTREKFQTEHQRLNRAIEILKEWKDNNPDIHVCCLAQIKRAQGKKTPDMDDLRKTSDIEEAAAWIGLLHNPELDDKEKEKMRGLIKGTKWKPFQIIFAKNRHGLKGKVTLQARYETQEIDDTPYAKEQAQERREINGDFD